MPDRYWLTIFAIIGLAIICAGLGAYAGALNQPHEDRYPSYRYSSDYPSESKRSAARPTHTEPLQYRTPCREPKGHDESDLCAQWRAAKAGEDSAFWTKWGVWIGIMGSCLLLWQIVLTRRAVEDTSEATKGGREANEIARESVEVARKAGETSEDIGRKQVRAYVSIESASLQFTGDGRAFMRVVFRNSGQSPALNFAFRLGSRIEPIKGDQFSWDVASEISEGAYSPLKPISANSTFDTGFLEAKSKIKVGTSGDYVFLGEVAFRYKTVFGDKESLRFHCTTPIAPHNFAVSDQASPVYEMLVTDAGPDDDWEQESA